MVWFLHPIIILPQNEQVKLEGTDDTVEMHFISAAFTRRYEFVRYFLRIP